MTTQDRFGKRAPRFARVAGAGMRLTARDMAILRAVFRYRFLRSTHIAALAGGSHQQVLRRLRLLYDHGLLDRPPAQAGYRAEPRNAPLVYGLGARGASVLAQADPSAHGRSDWTSRNKRAGQIFLDHTLMIADVMVAIELACREREAIDLIDEPDAVAMMPETTKGAKHPTHWKTTVSVRGGKRVPVGLFPDRVFSLAFDGKTRTNFLLEADRGTMRITPKRARDALERNSVNRKLLAYQSGWRAGYHTQRFGWRNFRVLTVTTSAARVKTMVAAVQAMDHSAGAGMFLFAEQDVLLAGNPLTHSWTDGKGNAVRLID